MFPQENLKFSIVSIPFARRRGKLISTACGSLLGRGIEKCNTNEYQNILNKLLIHFQVEWEESVLKKYGLETGGYKKSFTGGGLQNLWGGLEIFQERGGLTKKGWRKLKGGGCEPI